MSKVCEICGKRPVSGNNVSHAHNITKRRFNPNLQRIRALVNGVPKRMRVCTSCLKAGKITKRTNFSMPKRKAATTPAPATDSA